MMTSQQHGAFLGQHNFGHLADHSYLQQQQQAQQQQLHPLQHQQVQQQQAAQQAQQQAQLQQIQNPYANNVNRGMMQPTNPSPAPGQQQQLAALPVNRSADDDIKIYQWIMELVNGGSRETALLELSKKREQVDDLALILWHSFGKLG